MRERAINIMDSGEGQLSLKEILATIELLANLPNPRRELLEQLEFKLLEESEVIEACGTDVDIDEYFGIDDALNLLEETYARIDS